MGLTSRLVGKGKNVFKQTQRYLTFVLMGMLLNSEDDLSSDSLEISASDELVSSASSYSSSESSSGGGGRRSAYQQGMRDANRYNYRQVPRRRRF